MSTIFEKIIRKEVPAHVVAESEGCIGFLDIRPIVLGHTLVVSKRSKEKDLFKLGTLDYTELMLFCQKIAVGLQAAVPCYKVGCIVAGFDVLYAHVHLLPVNRAEDLNIKAPPITMSDSELSRLASLISSNV